VSQEPILFPTTIANNIRYGRPDATLDEIIEAAKLANAHDFIEQFPDGYNTHCGQRGTFLSGGQKQRIAIARAIVRDSTFILLDEATSALDSSSEKVVQQALDRFLSLKTRTAIIIAHRLSTVKNADIIAVISAGRVVELGTHEQLMENVNGEYRALVQRQTTISGPIYEREEKGSVFSEESELLEKELEQIDIKSVDSEEDLKAPLLNKKKAKTNPKFSMWRVFKLNKDEFLQTMMGVWFSGISGAIFPMLSFLLSSMIQLFYDSDPQNIRKQSIFWASMFACIAAASGLAQSGKIMCFTITGENLTARLRKLSFKSILRQEIAWFDDEKNSSGALCAQLATETTLVQNITGQNLANQVQNVITIVTALLIAFVLGSPKVSLMLMIVIPIVFIAYLLQAKYVYDSTNESQDHIREAGTVSSYAIDGIRTLVAFDMEEEILKLYSEELDEAKKQGIKRAIVTGSIVGFAEFADVSSLFF
jgi:ATP-binding cassette subfamily B (MDR/TAP) protein 1